MEQKLRGDRDIGSNLREMRIARGLSQEKLCGELQRRGCEIARSCYEKYEARQLNVRMSVLLTLKSIYGCPMNDFFTGLYENK